MIVLGLGLLIGASAYAAAWVGFAIAGRNPASKAWFPLHMLVVAGSMGIAAGLIGLQALQQHQVGALGAVATAMLFVGFLLAGVARQSVEAFTLPVMARVPSAAGVLVAIAGPLLFMGMLVLGIVTMLGGVLPAWTGAALVAAAVAGGFAAYVRVPLALHMAVSALGGVVLAYLGLLVVLASRR